MNSGINMYTYYNIDSGYNNFDFEDSKSWADRQFIMSNL